MGISDLSSSKKLISKTKDKILKDFDTKLANLKEAKAEIQEKMEKARAISDALNNPQNEIEEIDETTGEIIKVITQPLGTEQFSQVVDTMSENKKTISDQFEKSDDYKTLIENCPYLANSSAIANAVKLFNSAEDKITEMAENLSNAIVETASDALNTLNNIANNTKELISEKANELFDTIKDTAKDFFNSIELPDIPGGKLSFLPEFQFSDLIEQLEKLYETLGIAALLDELEKMAQCIEAQFKMEDPLIDISIQKEDIVNLRQDLYIGDDGKLNSDNMLSSFNLSDATKSGIKNMKQQIAELNNSIDESLDNMKSNTNDIGKTKGEQTEYSSSLFASGSEIPCPKSTKTVPSDILNIPGMDDESETKAKAAIVAASSTKKEVIVEEVIHDYVRELGLKSYPTGIFNQYNYFTLSYFKTNLYLKFYNNMSNVVSTLNLKHENVANYFMFYDSENGFGINNLTAWSLNKYFYSNEEEVICAMKYNDEAWNKLGSDFRETLENIISDFNIVYNYKLLHPDEE